MHFVFDCPLYYKIRGDFYNQLFEVDDRNLRNFFSDEKLMDAGTSIGKCMELRQAHLEANRN